MSTELICRICNIEFDFQLALECHLDFIHNLRAYMCEICDISEGSYYKGSLYTYFELIDHKYCVHGQNSYIILKNLNIY